MRNPYHNKMRRTAWPDTHYMRNRIMSQVQADIEALDGELALYEQCYSMSSKDFYAAYAQGTDGRLLWSPDFAAWGDLYVARLERELLYRRMLDQYDA